MIDDLQIIYPGMHPLPGAMLMMVLAFFGLLAIISLVITFRLFKTAKRKYTPYLFLVPSILIIVFIVYNWIGYNSIFNKYERQLIGTFYCSESKEKIWINSDKTWILKDQNQIKQCSGTWEFIASEDWFYWNISENNIIRIQTGDPKILRFRSGLEFIRKD